MQLQKLVTQGGPCGDGPTGGSLWQLLDDLAWKFSESRDQFTLGEEPIHIAREQVQGFLLRRYLGHWVWFSTPV